MRNTLASFATILIAAFCFTSVISNCGCSRKSQNGNAPETIDSSVTDFTGIISGDSMAPTVLGPHSEVNCDHCKFAVLFSLDAINKQIVCPNCGTLNSDSESKRSNQDPDEVQFHKSTGNQNVSRWSLVAFKSQGKNEHAIKRIVGLPNEKLELQSGDALVNGKRTIKSQELLNSLKILVHDSSFCIDGESRWRAKDSSVQFPLELADPKKGEIKDLRYINKACYAKRLGKDHEPIKDSYGFNQTVSRSLNEVGDLGCEFTFSSDMDFNSLRVQICSLKYGQVCFDINKTSDQSILISTSQNLGKQNLPAADPDKKSIEPPMEREDQMWEFWVVDGIARFIFDGNVAYETMLHVGKFDSSANAENQIRLIRMDAGRGSLKRVRVFRDLYYFDTIPKRSHILKSDEYFVIGDNVPISRDSRHFRYVRHHEIIGQLKSK